MRFRSRCRSSTSTPSGRAAARSCGSSRTARLPSDRTAPARCRGRPATVGGAAEPTVSDANLLLGRLPAGRSLAGGLVLDAEQTRVAFEALAARREGGGDAVDLASAALGIATAKMAGAVREVSVHRGFDPRDFTLLGFGGAGPMHAMPVAEELGITHVMVPRFPGHLSALGQMLADLRRDAVDAWGGRVSELSVHDLRARAKVMREDGAATLEADGAERGRHRHAFTLDVRYVGQSFTLPIPWSAEDPDWTPLRAAFDARHEETFGYADPANDIEIVNVRLVSIAEGRQARSRLSTTRQRRPGGRAPSCMVWRVARDPGLSTASGSPWGAGSRAPRSSEEAGGTTVAPPGWAVEVDRSGALRCEGSVHW